MTLRRNNKNVSIKFFRSLFVQSRSDRHYNCFSLWAIFFEPTRNGAGSKTIFYFPLHFQIIIYSRAIFPVLYHPRWKTNRPKSNVAKSTITGPRIATDKSRYGNHCRTPMRLAFSSLRESSCWLPAVIQLLVRKHSQDARHQRAIALKSLVVGFVVRENAASFFFLRSFCRMYFRSGFSCEKRPMESQFAVLLSRSPGADHTSFMANEKREENNRKRVWRSHWRGKYISARVTFKRSTWKRT